MPLRNRKPQEQPPTTDRRKRLSWHHHRTFGQGDRQHLAIGRRVDITLRLLLQDDRTLGFGGCNLVLQDTCLRAELIEALCVTAPRPISASARC